MLSSIICRSQGIDTNIVIHPSDNRLFTGKPNLIVIEYKVDTFQNISVKTSQGQINSVDKYLHYLTVKNTDSVSITVYNFSGQKSTILSQIKLRVDTLIVSKAELAIIELTDKCNLSIEGFSYSKIPLKIAKDAKKLTVSPPYNIERATLYIGNDNPLVFNLSSGLFENNIFAVLKRLSKGTIISIDNVIVKDVNNKTYRINGKSFIVTD